MLKLINKILLLMSLFLIIFVVLFTFCFGFLFMKHSRNVESVRLETTALSLADTIGKMTASNNLSNPYNNNVLQLVNILDQGEVWLVDKNTLNISGYKNKLPLKYNQLSGQAINDIQNILDGNIIRSTAFTNYTKPNYITVGVPVYNNNGEIIGALLFSSNLPDLIFSWYDGIAIMTFLAILLIILLLFSLKLLISKQILPLSVLNNFIDKIIQHDYSAHLKIKSQDEISLLASKLNDLSHYLHKIDQENQITTQTNSELILQTAYKTHTPLKELKSTLQMLENKPYAFDDKILKKLQENVKIIDSLTNNILTSSKYDLNHIKLKKDLLNIIELLEDSITLRTNYASDKHIQMLLNNHLEKKLLLFSGDKNRLRQMFCEILDKMLQSCPTDSTIHIDITEDQYECHICFHNISTEISTEQISSYFPQFYISPENENLSDCLELKIAQHIATLHNIKFDIITTKDTYPKLNLYIKK